jgi:predicted transcriptional regulator of viral defense system
MTTNAKKVLNLVRKAGVFRPKDLAPHGIPRSALQRLEQQGKVRRISRGLYELAASDPTEHIDLMEVCRRVPKGIVCLISALNFHNMTTQMPYEVWMAIGARAHKPKLARLPMRFVRFSGQALTHGVETHKIHGVSVRVTSPAKTVADCFKYRNKVGSDVAIEGLKAFLQKRKGKRDDLWRAAEVCRVTNVMRPYLEAFA